MSFADILRSFLEFAVGGFIIWGFFNEDKFVRFERRLFARLKGIRCHKGYAESSSPSSPSVNVISGGYNRIA